jgi:hypothetical protein
VLQEASLLHAMPPVFTRRFGLSRRLIRAIALLFLIYTAIDIASPDLCREEALGDGRLGLRVVTSPPVTADANASAARIAAAVKQRTNEPSEWFSDDDDCFCCCSHVLPGTVTATVAVTDIRSPISSLQYLSIPSPLMAPAFHPPRSV